MDDGAEARTSAAMTLQEVADIVGGRVRGDASLRITGIAPIDEALESELGLLALPRYVRHLPSTRAAALLVAERLESHVADNRSAVVVADAYAALRTLLQRLHPDARWSAEIHPTAVLGRSVQLGDGVRIEAYAVLEDGVRVGDRCRIGAHCVLGQGTVLGSDSRLYPHVVSYHDTVIGERAVIHSGARLGPDGFGYTLIEGVHEKIPQVGRCVIGDDVEIGANTTIDRGSLGDTRVESGVKLDNLVHIAHNVTVGARSLLAALVGIAGSTRLGKGVWMGGQSGAVNQLEIGDGARVVVQTGVTRDVPAGETVSGFPARPHREVMRGQAATGRIPDIQARLRRLEELALPHDDE